MEQEILQKLEGLQKEVEKLKKNPQLPDHRHTGYDSTKVEHDDVSRKKIYVHHTIFGASAATAANYGVIKNIQVPCILTKFSESHQVAGTDAGAVTLTLEKLTGTEAPDSGVAMLAATLSLKATANTVQDGTPTTTLSNRTLAVGDRLCLKDAGTPTSVSNVTIDIELLVI